MPFPTILDNMGKGGESRFRLSTSAWRVIHDVCGSGIVLLDSGDYGVHIPMYHEYRHRTDSAGFSSPQQVSPLGLHHW